MVAVIADQVASRSSDDKVPAALAALTEIDTVLPFERTAGDEIQALLARPEAVVAAISRLTRLGHWRIGMGLGEVEAPLPSSTRMARGKAYLSAREAIIAAKRSPTGLALRVDGGVSTHQYDLTAATNDAETALWLWRTVLARRSPQGWELVDLLDSGMTNTEAANQLGVSPSAISQRLSASAREEGRRGGVLCVRLLSRLQTPSTE